MRRVASIALAVVCLLVVAAGAALWEVGRRGSGAIEQWVGEQLQLVADASLNPKLTFADVDYEFPATIRIDSLKLTADDPDNPGKTIEILGAQYAEIELAEMPQVGSPLHIESVKLKDPLFSAVAIKGTHRLVGFSDLIREKPQAATVPAPSDVNMVVTNDMRKPPTSAPATQRLCDIIRMKRIELVRGKVVYDSRAEASTPMALDHINTSLDISRTGHGWYAIETRIRRDPIIDLAIAGKLNLNSFSASDVVVTLKAQLGREYDGYLPPDFQKLLREQDVKGVLEARVTGAFPVREPKLGNLKIDASLNEANMCFGQTRIPIDAMKLDGVLEQGRLMLTSLDVTALDGRAHVTGSVAMNDVLDSTLGLSIDDMQIDETIRPESAAATQPMYGGKMDAHVTAAAPLRTIIDRLKGRDDRGELPARWGQGRIELTEAQLVNTPLIRDLDRALNRGRSLLTGRTTQPSADDRASVVFTLSGDGARCSEIRYEGGMFAARGKGVVGLDRRLNLTFNAGPLEKMQSLMGRVGRVFGAVTDAIASYRVTGRIGETKVNVEIAGIASGG